jgi:hypothetical protein
MGLLTPLQEKGCFIDETSSFWLDAIGEGYTPSLQQQQQALDMAMEEVQEGLSEVQGILNAFKALCECFPNTVTLEAHLHILLASQHCHRILQEVHELLNPLSHLLQMKNGKLDVVSGVGSTHVKGFFEESEAGVHENA